MGSSNQARKAAAGKELKKSLEPARKKQRPQNPVSKVEADSETSDDEFPDTGDDDSDGDDESIEDDETQVEFAFHDPEESDFHVVKALVHPFLDGRDFDSSACADAIIDQAQVATCLRVGEDCMGVAAVLPLAAFPSAAFVKQVLKHWSAKADAACKPKLAAAAAGAAAILVSERVINAPPEVAAPLIAGLAADMKRCRELGADEAELRPYGAVAQLLVCAKAYVDGGVGADKVGAVRVSARATTAASASSSAVAAAAEAGELVFLKPEDECFYKHCEWSTTWTVQKTGEFQKDVTYQRVLMQLSRSGFRKAVQDLAKLLGHNQYTDM